MKEKPKSYREKPTGYVAEFLDKPNNVASATDETGLMPTPPETEAQAESYSEIRSVPKQPNHSER
ncbi:MAG: hypothetical protein RRY54_04515 [Angelakisella sp.]